MRIILTVLCVLILSAVVGTSAVNYRGPSIRTSIGAATASAQDAFYLDRRISMLETRLRSVESSMRSLQQQAMRSERPTTQPARDPEVTLLRSEVEILNSRLRELECALVRLDERTLSPSAKEAQRRTALQSSDPCRVNPDTPIQLSPRR
jgi:predicted  nucleic acid-binding Zn-ribbon protein